MASENILIDNIVEAVREKLRIRSNIGINKYGKTLDRYDLSRLDWLRHAQEEALDFALYIEKLIVLESIEEDDWK